MNITLKDGDYLKLQSQHTEIIISVDADGHATVSTVEVFG